MAQRLTPSPRGRHPLFIAVTGCGGAEERRQVQRAGIDLYLLKPAEPELLMDVLEWFWRVIAPVEAG